jgi:hypothetical protein
MSGSSDTWNKLHESVAGTSHIETGKPCQDSCRVSETDGNLIAVCADGAGSATHSEHGSELVCDKFIQTFGELLRDDPGMESVTQDSLESKLRKIRVALTEKAEELGVPIKQLATTLVGCVITKDQGLFVQIGDGAMVYEASREYRCVFWPQSGEYANVTNFLTAEDFENKFVWKIIPEEIRELVLFTDGLERLILKFDSETVHQPAFVPMLVTLRASKAVEELFEPLRNFLQSESVNERTDDDKTLVLASRINHAETVSNAER